MMMLGFLVFSIAAVVAGGTVFATLVSNAGRIADALAGRPQGGFHPLTTLVRAERRIAVRRWSAAPRASARLRAAA